MTISKKQLAEILVHRFEQAEADLARQWKDPSGTKTRHFVLDNVLPREIADEIAEAFPKDGSGFFQLDSFRERKRTLAKLSQTQPILGAVSAAFQVPEVVAAISRITGIDSLKGDSTYYAGGLSMMMPGDFLNPHVDNSHDGERLRYRRVNILYYVNDSWSLESGGNFELWDENVKQQKTIVSGFNRIVAMETNKSSWHSVSKVLVGRPRCCVSNYYFSEQSPDNTQYFHVTSFTGRPGERLRRVLGPLDNGVRYALLRLFRSWVPGKDRAENTDREGR